MGVSSTAGFFKTRAGCVYLGELLTLAVVGERLGRLLPMTAFPALVEGEPRPLLVIAGPGTDGARLRAQGRDAGVAGDVRVLGFRPAGELEGLYALARCLVLPTL